MLEQSMFLTPKKDYFSDLINIHDKQTYPITENDVSGESGKPKLSL